MNYTTLMMHWFDLSDPWLATSLGGGTNNAIWRVESQDGAAYVLRIMRSHDAKRRVQREAILLRALAPHLPFAVPIPLMTRSGTQWVVLNDDAGGGYATLVPFIAGVAPERDDLGLAAVAGEGLGQLDVALARLTLEPPPGETVLVGLSLRGVK